MVHGGKKLTFLKIGGIVYNIGSLKQREERARKAYRRASLLIIGKIKEDVSVSLANYSIHCPKCRGKPCLDMKNKGILCRYAERYANQDYIGQKEKPPSELVVNSEDY